MPAAERGQPDSRASSRAPRCCSTGTTDDRQEQVVLAYQRYGRGKALALPVQDSWIWQMDATMPVEDMTHATFWRRLVRWLVDGVPDPGEPSRPTLDRVEPGEPVQAHRRGRRPGVRRGERRAGRRAGHRRRRARRSRCRWSGPSRRTASTAATFVPDEPGSYEIKRDGDARRQGARHEHACTCARRPATASTSTRRCARRCSSAIAEETGGRFFTPANAASLPEAISYSGRGVTVVEERDLWDMPIAPAAAARPDRRRVGATGARGGSHERGPGRRASRLRRVRAGSLVGARPALLAARPRRRAAQDTHLLVITGVGGDDEHAKQFHKWATTVVDAAKKRGVPDANITYLGEQARAGPGAHHGRSTRENVTKAFTDLAATRASRTTRCSSCSSATAASTARRRRSTCPARTSRPHDYATLLDKLAAAAHRLRQHRELERRVPRSRSPARAARSSRRRKTGGERNETRFAEFFVEAFDGDGADRDRNGRVSVLEAFDYAKTKVVGAYEQGGHILTEHATLDDGSEGKLAATQFLAPQRSRTAAADGRRRPGAARAASSSATRSSSRSTSCGCKKDSMDPAQYEQQLEKLLTDLALKTRRSASSRPRNEDALVVALALLAGAAAAGARRGPGAPAVRLAGAADRAESAVRRPVHVRRGCATVRRLHVSCRSGFPGRTTTRSASGTS